MNINAKQIAKKYNVLDVVFKFNFRVLFIVVITANGFSPSEEADF
jgi:hypothetical protein